jgi:hypothetical protein
MPVHAVLSTCAYIDLNPVAAGIVAVPEESAHTSIHARVEHVRAAGLVEAVRTETGVEAPARPMADDPEAGLWLCPV